MNFHRRLLMLLVFTLVVALAGFNGVAQGQAVKNPDTQTTRDDKGALIPDIYDRTNRAIQVNGDTVAITLKDPYSPFLSILATWSVVHSKKFVVANGGWDGSKATLASFNNPAKPDVATLFDKSAGTGPFKLERWDRGTKTVTLARNDNYWRAPAKLRRVIYQTA